MSKSNGADRGPPIEWYDIEWTSKLKARWQRWVMGVDRNQLTAAERVVAFWLADHVNTDPKHEGFGTAWPPTTNGRRQGTKMATSIRLKNGLDLKSFSSFRHESGNLL